MPAVMMMAMSAAFRVCARLQVAHINFLFLFFGHVAFLNCFWVVSAAPNIFRFDQLHDQGIITPRANKFRGTVLTF